MKTYGVYFVKKRKCRERVFDDAPKCINYIRRYVGNIKDYEIYPNYYKNADVVIIEAEDIEIIFVKIITPLGGAQKIEDALAE